MRCTLLLYLLSVVMDHEFAVFFSYKNHITFSKFNLKFLLNCSYFYSKRCTQKFSKRCILTLYLLSVVMEHEYAVFTTEIFLANSASNCS